LTSCTAGQTLEYLPAKPGMGAVPDYRIYTIDKQGHISGPPTVVDCTDDDEVLKRAQLTINGADVEIWQDARLVVRLPGDPERR
jgi:hypothetical protein